MRFSTKFPHSLYSPHLMDIATCALAVPGGRALIKRLAMKREIANLIVSELSAL